MLYCAKTLYHDTLNLGIKNRDSKKNPTLFDYFRFFTKFSVFSIIFGSVGDSGWFWPVKSTYSDRKILHLPSCQVSFGVLERIFFLNWPGSSKFTTQTWDMYFYV